MRQLAFSVRDAQAELFSRPFYFPTRGMAVRNFMDQCQDKDSPMRRHPDDFALYQVGEFDDNAGVFLAMDSPHLLYQARDSFSEEKSNEDA